MYRFILAIWLASAVPSAAFTQATFAEKTAATAAHTTEEGVVTAIRSRLDATARNDVDAWSRFVADEMLAPLEGDSGSKQAWIRTHGSWPREVKYWYGPLQDIKVRVRGETAVVAYHAMQFTKFGEQTTSVHKWQIERAQGRPAAGAILRVCQRVVTRERNDLFHQGRSGDRRFFQDRLCEGLEPPGNELHLPRDGSDRSPREEDQIGLSRVRV